nr:immunoglobulin light chain junction region [Macaca mulatta]
DYYCCLYITSNNWIF